MKFIKELIASKSWSGGTKQADQEDYRRDLETDDFDTPLLNRVATKAAAGDGAQDENWDEFDSPEFADLHPKSAASDTDGDVTASVMDDEKAKAWLEDFDALDADENSWLQDEDDEDDEDEGDWDLGPASTFNDAEASRPRTERAVSIVRAVSGPPPANTNDTDAGILAGDTLADYESAESEDDEYTDDLGEAAIEAVMAKEDISEADRQAMLLEIQAAMDSVRHIRTDEELGRQAAAREQLGLGADSAPNSRILDETNEILNEDTGARRRQAIALLKNVAAATRTDPILQSLSGAGAGEDQVAQDSYREDLEALQDNDRRPSLLRKSRPDGPEPTEVDASEPAVEPKSEPEAAPEVDDPFAQADEPPEWAQKAVEAEQPEPQEAPAPSPRETSKNRVDNLRAALMSKPLPEDNDAQDAYVDESDDLPTAAAPTSATSAAPGAPEPAPTPETPHAVDAGQADPIVDISDALSGLAAAGHTPAPAAPVDAGDMQIDPAPAAAMGRAGRQAGRVKTRLLGFQSAAGPENDLFARPVTEPRTPQTGPAMFPLGWIVVVEGPGRGASFPLTNGVCQIGRSAEQSVPLNFGDTSISRENHAAIAYDDEQNKFFLGHGGKSNLVRLNGKPVLSTEELNNADHIRIGETTLHFVALCGGGFSWQQSEGGNDGQEAIA